MQGDNIAVSIEDGDEDECIFGHLLLKVYVIFIGSEACRNRKKRFERIQMEGTKDPRRGGSGTAQ